ncbi:unnamed protein product [Sphagnum jensenii]|uniref:Uncharacterized protein n=1 Tax=Sphagnum jensenii TaxID=128206 RepID=A0ABP0W139_9BRYO
MKVQRGWLIHNEPPPPPDFRKGRGLILQCGHIVMGADGHFAAVVMEFQARDAKVVLVFFQSCWHSVYKHLGILSSDGQNLLVYGMQFGNVFIGIQPNLG